MIREIISSTKTVDSGAIKSANSFISDVSGFKWIEPSVIKIGDDDAFRMYRANEWLFAVINRIVDDCAKVRPRVSPKDRTKRINRAMQLRIDAVKDFLDDPNANKESFREIREKLIRDMLIYGRGAVEKVVSRVSRTIGEIYAVQAKTIKVKVDRHGTIPEQNAYIQIDPKGKEVFFARDEMMFVVLTPTTETLYGVKKVDTLATAVASDILRATYNANFFVNGAEASGIISLEGMSKPELKKFREYWQAVHKGARNAHKTAAVSVPVKYIRMALTNRDIEFSQYGMELRSKIFAVYSMQPLVMGIVDQSTGRLNSAEQVQSYKDGALKPILDKESYAYTKEIVNEGFGYKDIQIDFSEVDLADAVQQAAIDRLDLGSGVLTINEVRSRRSLAPVKWGDTPLTVLPGGGQIDPDTGRLIIPSKTPQTGQPAPSKKPAPKPSKGIDVPANLIASYIMLCVDSKTDINEEKILHIITDTTKTGGEAAYLMYLSDKLLAEKKKDNFVDEIDKIVDGTKTSIYYEACE